MVLSFLIFSATLWHAGSALVSAKPHTALRRRRSSLIQSSGLVPVSNDAASNSSDPFPFSPGFDIQSVAEQSKSLPSHSWEFGTTAESLLELYNPEYSVFGSSPFPVPTLNPDDVESLSYAAQHITIGKMGLSEGSGATGDPASLGVAAVMLGKTREEYKAAAEKQMDYLVNQAPRFGNGAISHRANVAELWADFMYMAPPFLAYYAVDTNDFDLLNQTFYQCSYYRDVLRSEETSLWKHIIGPESQDTGHWSTGNAWAAAGMARVLATIQKASSLPTLLVQLTTFEPWKDQAVSNLTQWIQEILDAAMQSQLDQKLLRNYLDDLNSDGDGFGEISGSSLLASVIYRMAVLAPSQFGDKYIDWADRIRGVLSGNDSDGKPHITSTGIATPAVNPLAWKDTKPFTTGSPEGNSFVVLVYSAWRECVLANVCSRS